MVPATCKKPGSPSPSLRKACNFFWDIIIRFKQKIKTCKQKIRQFTTTSWHSHHHCNSKQPHPSDKSSASGWTAFSPATVVDWTFIPRVPPDPINWENQGLANMEMLCRNNYCYFKIFLQIIEYIIIIRVHQPISMHTKLLSPELARKHQAFLEKTVNPELSIQEDSKGLHHNTLENHPLSNQLRMVPGKFAVSAIEARHLKHLFPRITKKKVQPNLRLSKIKTGLEWNEILGNFSKFSIPQFFPDNFEPSEDHQWSTGITRLQHLTLVHEHKPGIS